MSEIKFPLRIEDFSFDDEVSQHHLEDANGLLLAWTNPPEYIDGKKQEEEELQILEAIKSDLEELHRIKEEIAKQEWIVKTHPQMTSWEWWYLYDRLQKYNRKGGSDE